MRESGFPTFLRNYTLSYRCKYCVMTLPACAKNPLPKGGVYAIMSLITVVIPTYIKKSIFPQLSRVSMHKPTKTGSC